MNFRQRIALLGLLFLPLAAWSAPPADPAARRIYDHDYEWLSHFQPNFIVTNIRGENDEQYRERRQAALDLLRAKHDLTTVPDLMDELSRKSFLSADICELLGEMRAKKALPLLKEVAADSSRPKEVRSQAEKAIQAINVPVKEDPRPVY
jgi:hypothetical protein